MCIWVTRQCQSQPQTISQSLMPVPPQSQHLLCSHGLTYLVAQHKHTEVLQAEKVITGHLTLQPMGMQSEMHRKLVCTVGQKHNKVAGFRMVPIELVTSNPNIPGRPRCTPRTHPSLMPHPHTCLSSFAGHAPAHLRYLRKGLGVSVHYGHLAVSRATPPCLPVLVCRPHSCPFLTSCLAAFICRPCTHLSLMHAWWPSFAGHMPARPSCHAWPSSFACHTPGCSITLLV